ncbi:MAG: transcriptional regulator [Gammaproteobacteria bacterium RIFCSPHIGHO2_12_FULL_45_9]|nr:MAG: transcriptional regulator [Gammaproteobacteria bacterium RIFCSPHIGHO2_12_FULL_45_9]
MFTQKHNNPPSESTETEWQPIPDKLYFTIGEVSVLCHVKPHVLRYWEQEFTQLHPLKRQGNRRYYQRKEILLIRKIRHLLYDEGFTIEGARHHLQSPAEAEQEKRHERLYEAVRHAVVQLERVVESLEVS